MIQRVMNKDSVEPGLLSVFRLLVGIRLGLLWLTICLWLIAPDQRGQRFPFLGFAETAVLLIYLFWRWPQRVLGRLYLPLAIGIATLGPMLEYAANALLRFASSSSTDEGLEIIFLILVLFIPLLILSWQYNFRVVLAYCVATSLFDIALAIPLSRFGGPKVGDIIGLSFLRSVLYALVGFMVVRLMVAQRAQRTSLSDANTQLARYAAALEQLTISRERNRLARELHDTLAHTLSALAVQLEAAHVLWETDPAKSHVLLDQSLALTRTGLVDARRAIQSLRAAPLQDLGLTLAVDTLAESVAARSGIALDLYTPQPITKLTPEVEQAVYRIADEALANVTRHAQARHVSVKLFPSGSHQIKLIIADDGQGFDPAQSASNGHYGLKGLHERAGLIGATLAIESQPGQGTRVELTVEAGS